MLDECSRATFSLTCSFFTNPPATQHPHSSYPTFALPQYLQKQTLPTTKSVLLSKCSAEDAYRYNSNTASQVLRGSQMLLLFLRQIALHQVFLPFFFFFPSIFFQLVHLFTFYGSAGGYCWTWRWCSSTFKWLAGLDFFLDQLFLFNLLFSLPDLPLNFFSLWNIFFSGKGGGRSRLPFRT